jgi:hypothetical protein
LNARVIAAVVAVTEGALDLWAQTSLDAAAAASQGVFTGVEAEELLGSHHPAEDFERTFLEAEGLVSSFSTIFHDNLLAPVRRMVVKIGGNVRMGNGLAGIIFFCKGSW